MTIGQALKSLRLHAGMTQTEMAAGIVTESFYSKVERGVHAIDANVLIQILAKHHFDVPGFFGQISNQKAIEPYFDLTSQITFAQNKRDRKKLDEIKIQLENSKTEAPQWLKFKLELAYAWVLRSNEQVSPKLAEKVKQLILNENWDRTSYHFLSQAVILLQIDDAKYLVDLSYKAYLKEPKYDTFTLQFVSFIAINYLNCCYHQHVDDSYTTSTFEFLQKLPPDPAIGLEKMIGRFYQTVFADNKEKARALKDIIGDCGYAGIIDEIKI